MKKQKKVVRKQKSKLKDQKQLITKSILITDLMKKYPDSINIMFKYGLHCISCGLSGTETLEDGCKAHFMSDGDIKNMIDEINQAVNPKLVLKESKIKISKPQEIRPILQEKQKIPLEQISQLKKKTFWSKLFKGVKQ
ncbi:DUF1858 domain-containing protein [Candidatus Woesearchaeota archaeon]|nr:DUF1858 domain-containing protein [Candidatus Woesearchaeota archaeon]